MKLDMDILKFEARFEVSVLLDIMNDFLSTCDDDDDRIEVALVFANLLDYLELNW